MIAALINGSLFRACEQRTSKAGKLYATGVVRVKDGDGSLFIRITAFGETAQTELLRLQDGDALACQGNLKAQIYSGSSEPRISLNLMVDSVLALRPVPKERKPKAPPDRHTRQERLAGTWTPDAGPSDGIPF